MGWTETRGYTLRIQALSGERYVRLSLVRGSGLMRRLFNVHEARAERETRGAVAGLGEGRALSWRPLRETEANEAFTQRLSTLEALGYEVVDADAGRRGHWDWLRALAKSALDADRAADPAPSPAPQPAATTRPAAASAPEAEDSPAEPAPSPRAPPTPSALETALTQVSDPEQLHREGIAEVLGIEAAKLERPDASTIARADADVLAALLPVLVDHEDLSLAAVGAAWLQAPNTMYELDPEVVLRWLAGPPTTLQRAAARRLESEGLALLGVARLHRLAARAQDEAVQRRARNWCDRT